MRHGQKIIIAKETYTSIPYNIIQLPLKELNGNALKMYIFFCSLNAGERYELSPSFFCEETNMSLTGEKNAINELQLKGYLKEIETDVLEFYPTKIDMKKTSFVYPKRNP